MSPRTRRNVMISSTAIDLPEHRKQVAEACLRMDCTPVFMETLTAADADAVQKSLEMVNRADIYLGIFAHRYGYVPAAKNPRQVSITEMEYDRAVERNIPRLVFFIDPEVPVKPSEVETGPGAEKLKRLKDRIGQERVAGFFKSPADLRGLVIQALSEYREQNVAEFHYVSPIPPPPEPYVAHPYTLMESRRLIGRRDELNWLTDWVAQPGSPPHASRLFFLVAIGGMGKSALTWHWFQQIAEQEMRPLAGRMWWSFYESDAHFENFVIRGLAYTTRRTIDEIRKLPPAERETELLAALDREPHLVVLDGLERILIAYARADASRLADDDLDRQTANYVARAYGLPPEAAESFTGQHRLRLTVDPRAGSFLRKLSTVRASRILVTTRLYPADLQTANDEPLGNCFAYFLTGLSDDDALELWRAAGSRGSRETMLPLLKSFDKHPLLVQALASVVAHDRRAVGDFDEWRRLHRDFNPFPLLGASQRKSHVLAHALRGLDERCRAVLHTIACFRMATTYDTLCALFCRSRPPDATENATAPSVGQAVPDAGNSHASQAKPDLRETVPQDVQDVPSGGRDLQGRDLLEHELDAALTELEDRGLLGWDRRANRYDLHPIVRGVVFSDLDAAARREIYTGLHEHFQPIKTPDYLQVESLDDLTPAIELLHTLIELGRYEDAFQVFQNRLSKATLFRLSASRLRVELVERLFPDGPENPPRLSRPRDQGFTLNALAQGYQLSGQPGAAVPVFRRKCELDEREDDQQNLSVGLCNLSYAQRSSGDVRGAEASARRALRITRQQKNEYLEACSLYLLGLALSVRNVRQAFQPDCEAGKRDVGQAGKPDVPLRDSQNKADGLEIRPTEEAAALHRSLRLFQKQHYKQAEGQVNAYRAEVALWRGDAAGARTLADRAWELAAVRRYEANFICAARLQGTAALRVAIARLTAGPTDRESCRVDFSPPKIDQSTLSNEDLAYAHDRLHHALTRARGCQLVQEELPTLVALAELHLLLADPAAASAIAGSPASGLPNLTPDEHLRQARHLLDDVWDRCERGPYPLFHADARNMLATIERATADRHPPDSSERRDALAAAGRAAEQAYELAWLQGPPFAYARGLAQAQSHLAALGLTPPALPPYDPTQYDPMPEVEIDPPDESPEPSEADS